MTMLSQLILGKRACTKPHGRPTNLTLAPIVVGSRRPWILLNDASSCWSKSWGSATIVGFRQHWSYMDIGLFARRFVLQRARLVALVQLGSAALVCIGSIWVGAWFPDAQSDLYTKLKKTYPVATKPSFWEVTKSGWQVDSPVPYTVLGVILSVIAGAGVLVTASRVGDLEKIAGKYEVEQEAHAETQRHYLQSLHEHLKSYFCSRIPNFDDSCRASIYRHDVHNNVVRMVFRYCAFTRWNHKGRVSIPDNEGVIGAVMENTGNVYISKLPLKTNLKKYTRATNKSLETHGTLIMEVRRANLRKHKRRSF
jgi:hypothetical protein